MALELQRNCEPIVAKVTETLSGFDFHSKPLLIDGCAGSGDAFCICSLFLQHKTSICVFVSDSKHAERLAHECASIVGEQLVTTFPSRDAIPYNMRSPFGPTTEKRFSCLAHLMHGDIMIYIAVSSTLLQKIPPPRDLFNHIITLHPNDEIAQDTLAQWLVENGFTRETIIQDIGSFAIRGGIVDIYPFISENPIRLEFWGDTIESIREFDIFKQTSLSPRSSIELYPMKEFCFSEKQIEQGLVRIEKQITEANIVSTTDFQKLKHTWKTQTDHEGIEWFHSWFDFPYSSILEYLPKETVIVWNDLFDPSRRLTEDLGNYTRHLKNVPASLLPFVSQPSELLIPVPTIVEALSFYSMVCINTHMPHEQDNICNLNFLDQPSFNGNLPLFNDDIITKGNTGFTIYILCENNGHRERMEDLIVENAPHCQTLIGYIEQGFVDPAHSLAVYSENQLFNRTVRSLYNKKSKKSVAVTSLDTLLPGDHVVHVDHGIARFIGIERVKTIGNQQDCMVLTYQKNAKVYVPVEDFHKVQKYIGKDGSAPSLSTLGTNRWEKQKEKTRVALREMAEKLIHLYAKRECFEGIAFSQESVWEKEFDDSFVYEPTPDQIAAIEDVKKDMESSQPMDRLVCGDVGFGKTEIAMRAAVKAALNGYQVAILAPTTILAAQHHATFSTRMAQMPLKIAMLSRFCTPQEEKKILPKLKDGSIDIIIGTHRLLSKDIIFKNLGLLIIDEEQRFGVRHKEKLKELRYAVDVLSLTATPIPRTLHLSLLGIRDLSIINTPPRNRLPIETHVLEYHEEIIKTAIENELDRGGQVYVVHNRIQNLTVLHDTIALAVPRARIVIAHGQMEENYLEQIMKEFVVGNYDVLISTTIIENGLDIPNVNTIIVNRADALGLSQLYQLRGRVGRSSEQAYAYFLTNPFKEIKDVSLKRLRALQQYTDLGSGFQIAMRDLEIRGAGNILGANQHGNIAAVGFDLYCRLLKEEIDRIKGEAPAKNEIDVKIELPIDAYIPADYVTDSSVRIVLYQECSGCKSFTDVQIIEKEFYDRFGPLPEPVKILLLMIELKILAQQVAISHISLSHNNILSLSVQGQDTDAAHNIQKIITRSKATFEIVYGAPVVLKTTLISLSPQLKVLEIRDLLTFP